jgi:hypothetical protein
MAVLTIVVAVFTFACLGLCAWFGGRSCNCDHCQCDCAECRPERQA